jgi:hypothetical protein
MADTPVHLTMYLLRSLRESSCQVYFGHREAGPSMYNFLDNLLLLQISSNLKANSQGPYVGKAL